MIFGKSIALPVVVALAILGVKLAQAGDVRVFNYTQDEIDVGDVWSDQTTTAELKKIIANKVGIELDRVRLAVIKSNTPLEDERLLSDYISIYEDGLFLRLCDDLKTPAEVHVNFANNRIEIIAKKDKTLAWLIKEALGDEDPKLYRVFYHGEELTDYSKTLGELQFYRDTNVILWKKDETFKINVVSSSGQEREFDIGLDMGVDDLRKLIEDSGIDVDNHMLVHNGKVLEEHKKLFSHSIHPFFYGYLVHVVERLKDSGDRIVLFYKKPQNIVQFSVNVKSSTTVRELKEFAFKVSQSIPVEEMQLSLIDVDLTGDSRSLSEFNIYSGAWIRISNQRK